LVQNEPKPTEAKWWNFKESSPFEYKELRKGIKRREKAEKDLQNYLSHTKTIVNDLNKDNFSGKIGAAEFNARMKELQAEVECKAQEIIYGTSERGSRSNYEKSFGCVKWTEEALAEVSKYSPIIEIGAGRGHWQSELEKLGVDIIAFDNGESPHPFKHLKNVGRVERGNESSLKKFPGRTLLLVYPPKGDMAARCLEHYQGNFFIYIGEGKGGVNACDSFFAILEENWKVEKVVKLDPFPECFERMFVMKRLS